MHYIGEINYYNEYNESAYQDAQDRDPNIYLIYVINGTYLINHIENSNYEVTGHYITFSEDHILPFFLDDMEAFQNIFGKYTKVIMPSPDIITPYTNFSNLEYIDEEVYQKIMIDVITDVYDLPFYRLFPQFYITHFLFVLINITMIASIMYFLFFVFMYRYKFKINYFPWFQFFIFISFLIFDLIISADLDIREDYEICLNSHYLIDFYFNVCQFLQFLFIVYLLEPIDDDKIILYASIALYCAILILKEVDFNSKAGSLTIFIVFIKIAYYIFVLYNVNKYKNNFSTSSGINNPLIEEKKDSDNYNEIFVIIIILILLELYFLVDNGYIFYYLLFNFWLMLIVLFYPLERKQFISIKE